MFSIEQSNHGGWEANAFGADCSSREASVDRTSWRATRNCTCHPGLDRPIRIAYLKFPGTETTLAYFVRPFSSYSGNSAKCTSPARQPWSVIRPELVRFRCQVVI